MNKINYRKTLTKFELGGESLMYKADCQMIREGERVFIRQSTLCAYLFFSKEYSNWNSSEIKSFSHFIF